MKNLYKLIVAYDGTDYEGWQTQRNGKTVAEALEKSFQDVFEIDCNLLGVSRTDSGVHAMGQVVCIKTSLDVPPEKLVFALNNRLQSKSGSIVVRSAIKAGNDFKLHADVVEKTYHYHFFTDLPQPFVARYGWYVSRKIDLNKLKECLQVFVGTHDFRSFCTGDDWDDTVRTINSIDLEYLQEQNMYRIVVKGPRFLRYMIRRVVGACIQVACSSTMKVEHLIEVISQKNPEQRLFNAPAKGLMLYNIRYKGDGPSENKITFKLF